MPKKPLHAHKSRLDDPRPKPRYVPLEEQEDDGGDLFWYDPWQAVLDELDGR